MRIFFALTLLSLLAACAAPNPKMTREEYLQATQRTYEGKTKEDVLAAAERAFSLMDEPDFDVHHADDSITGHRSWLVFLLITVADGADTWTVRTKPVDGGVLASASVSRNSSAMMPMATTGGDWTGSSMSNSANYVGGTALYDLFWARIDYLMGLRSDWMTCEDARERLKAGITKGSLDHICDPITMEDDHPDKPTKASLRKAREQHAQ